MKSAQNTDRELWRENPGDYYSPSIHVTKDGKIGINVGGIVHVRSLKEWHGSIPHRNKILECCEIGCSKKAQYGFKPNNGLPYNENYVCSSHIEGGFGWPDGEPEPESWTVWHVPDSAQGTAKEAENG